MSDVLDLLEEGRDTAAPAPGGIAALLGGLPPMESQSTDMVVRTPDQLERWASLDNIAMDPDITDEQIVRLAAHVVRDYDIDEQSRNEYRENYRLWLDFAMQLTEQKTYPWPDASNVIYPLMTNASVQFAARAYPGIIRDRDVVKGVVVGDDSGQPMTGPMGEPIMEPDGQPAMLRQPGEKQARADLIGRHMSWQLLFQQPEWEPETDRLLVILPIVGTVFRKVLYSRTERRNMSVMVTALDLCVNYNARSFETAPRQTELLLLYPWEIEERRRSGMFRDVSYGTNTTSQSNRDGQHKTPDPGDDDAPTTFLEQHRRWDLDGDGYAEPYIVTVARDSGVLARIVAGYEPDEIQRLPSGRVLRVPKVQYYTKYSFIPSPESTVYDIGFGHLLYPMNASINTTLNQMFDAGHLQNAGGGFVGSGVSINTGAVRFQVGEYKPVNTMGGTLRDNIMPLPFPGPSAVLFNLLVFLVEAGERVAGVKDVMAGDMPGDNTSGITTLAVIEQGLKVFSAIYKRIHRALKSEFTMLYRLNRLHLAEATGWNEGDTWEKVTREDYERGSGVAPVSDPNMVTDAQRLGRAQLLLSMKDDPRVDGAAVIQEAWTAAGIAKPERFLAKPQGPAPAFVLKNRELDIREANNQRELQLRSIRDRAAIVRDLAQAEQFLADARAKDGDADLRWAQVRIDELRIGLEAIEQEYKRESDARAAAAGGQSGA